MPTRLTLTTLLICGALAIPASVAAQGEVCGKYCNPCQVLGTQGQISDLVTPYSRDCTISLFCDSCNPGGLVAESGADVADIVDAVRRAPVDRLHVVVAEYGDRLLIHESRDLLAIRGTACDPNLIPTVLFLRPQKVAALVALGIQDLEGFIAETTVEPLRTE